MSFRCNQCSFTSQFESALRMHRQLYHDDDTFESSVGILKSSDNCDGGNANFDQGIQLQKKNSALKFFDKFRLNMNRSRSTLSVASGGETPSKTRANCHDAGDGLTCCSDKITLPRAEGPYVCHLCNFSTNRITLLDRHLLDDHKIGLDNLLKLVMANTKAKYSDANSADCHTKNQYYQHPTEADFVTVFERAKEFKTVATNTESCTPGSRMKEECGEVTKQLEQMLSVPLDKLGQGELLNKMAALNEHMRSILGSCSSAVGDLDATPEKEDLFDIDAFLNTGAK